MNEHQASAQFRLMRVEGSAAEARAILVGTFGSLDEAVAAAAAQPRQPIATWKPDDVDGVWGQLDPSGLGFVVHRIDPPRGPQP